MTARRRPDLRVPLFAALYFGEGAPIGFLWWALPTRLRVAGAPVGEITALTALLVLPWTFKFVWAPLVDVLRNRWWSTRHWIVLAQLGMAGTLLPLAWLDLADDFETVRMLLFAHAFFAATQDVAIDALCIRHSTPEERGRLNGWMQAGMLLGRSLFGGGTLILFDWFGLRGVVGALAATTLLASVLVWIVPLHASGVEAARHAPKRLSLSATWRRILTSPATWWGVVFALTAGAAFEAFGAVQGTMLVDRGSSQAFIGTLLAVPMVGGMLVGSLLGGYAADRFGHARVVAVGVVGCVASVLAVAWTIGEGTGPPARAGVAVGYCTVALAIGVFTASSYALLMDLARPEIAATQFSTFMGATNGCEAWAAFAVGQLAAAHGYGIALTLVSAASVVGLLWLSIPRRQR